MVLVWNKKWKFKEVMSIYILRDSLRGENGPSMEIGHKKWDSELQNKVDRERDNKGWSPSGFKGTGGKYSLK